jgi:hypothetical protein
MIPLAQAIFYCLQKSIYDYCNIFADNTGTSDMIFTRSALSSFFSFIFLSSDKNLKNSFIYLQNNILGLCQAKITYELNSA